MIKHPNIVTLKEAFRRREKLYLVFEFVNSTILEMIEKVGAEGLEVRAFIIKLRKV